MTEMNMDRFEQRQEAVASNSGFEYGDIPKFVVDNSAVGRIVGDFASAFEHFVNLPAGPRPYYCEGPDSDCPICNACAQLAATDDPQAQKVAKDVKAKEKFYFNILDRSPAGMAWHAGKKEAKLLVQSPKANNIGTMVFQAIGSIVKMRKQTGQSADPNTFDIMFTKTGSGMATKYGAQFTGVTTPLTEEEKAYKLWPVQDIAKITSLSEREVVASALLNGSVKPQDDEVAGNPQKPQAAGPMSQRMQKPNAAPPPAQAPRAQQAAKPPAQLNQAPAKLAVKPPSKFQSTELAGRNPQNLVEFPCEGCGATMFVDLDDERDIECHGCKKIYAHPNNQTS